MKKKSLSKEAADLIVIAEGKGGESPVAVVIDSRLEALLGKCENEQLNKMLKTLQLPTTGKSPDKRARLQAFLLNKATITPIVSSLSVHSQSFLRELLVRGGWMHLPLDATKNEAIQDLFHRALIYSDALSGGLVVIVPVELRELLEKVWKPRQSTGPDTALEQEEALTTIRNLINAVMANEDFKEEFAKARARFFGGEPSEPNRLKMDQAWIRLLEWFSFDYVSPAWGMSPAERYLTDPLSKFRPGDKKRYEVVLDQVVSIFKLQGKPQSGKLKLQDCLTTKNYTVLPSPDLPVSEAGSILIGRLYRVGKNYLMSPGMALFPPGDRQFLDKVTTFNGILGALMIEMLHSGEGGRYKPEDFRYEEDAAAILSPEASQWRLRRLLKLWNLKLDIKSLNTAMAAADSPDDAFKEFFKGISLYPVELRRLYSLVASAWSTVPRDELGGLTPREAIERRGKQEKRLMGELFDLIRLKQSKQNYANYDEAEVAASQIFTDWVDKPQPRLAGKSPRMAILEERKNHGNPNQNIAFYFEWQG